MKVQGLVKCTSVSKVLLFLALIGLQGCALVDQIDQTISSQTDNSLTKAYELNKRQPGFWGHRKDPENIRLINGWSKSSPEINCAPQVIHVPNFPNINKDLNKKLLRHFSSSIKWYTDQQNNYPVAQRRFVVDGNWERTQIHFQPKHLNIQGASGEIYVHLNGFETSPKAVSRTHILNGAKNSTIHLKHQDNQNISYTYFHVGKSVVEIREFSPFCSREFTQAAIVLVHQEIERIAKSESVQKLGFDPALLPEGSMKSGDSELKIRRIGKPGVYYIETFVNPQQFGYIYLKLIDLQSQKVINPDFIKALSHEYTGWSKHSIDNFFYSGLVEIPKRGSFTPFPVRFELWFHSLDHSQPEQLLQSQIFQVNSSEF